MKNFSTPKGISLYLILFSSLFFFNSTRAQSGGRIAEKVSAFKQKNSFSKETNLFSVASKTGRNDLYRSIKNFTLLNTGDVFEIVKDKPAFLNLLVPAENGSKMLRVLLYKESISANGFTLLSSDGKTDNIADIVHYKGAVDGDPASVAAFSFSGNEVTAMINNNDGNYVLGKLPNSSEHILYNDKDLVEHPVFDCGTNTNIPMSAGNYYRENTSASSLTAKCVNWYWETDVDIFNAKGSLANVNTFMQGVFNQVQTLYANDGVSITLKTLYVWTTEDPYTGTSTSSYLDQFGVYRTTFDGDLATLIGTKGGGGIAWINGLCNSQNKYKMAYCGISTSYSTVPNYSWTVECITHEQGHLLGSRHTHDCAWNGNNTKIDGCGDNAGYVSGTCANPGNPAGGGTIMSYCHLTSVGINFNLGFGPQPKALITTNVNNASCLTLCTSACTTPDQPAAISGNATVCAATAQAYSIAAVAGATSYTWTLPSGWSGSSTTNSINTTAGSAGGTISVTAVNSCGSGTSRTLSVTVNAAPAQPGNISGNAAVCPGTAQTYTVSAIAGATSYTWLLPSGWSGTSTTNSINVTSGTSGGSITVKANNACGNSAVQTLAVTITASAPQQPGSISGATVSCPGATQVYSVAAVNGAGSYTWVLPSGWSGSSNSNSISVTTGSAGGNISVSASNGCGTSAIRSLTVSGGGALPPAPGTITSSGGTANVCTGDTRSYTVAATSGLTYTWSAPSGATIVSGQGSNSISVTFSSAFSAPGTLSVAASNSCGTGPVSTLTISKNTISKPSVITVSGGTPKVCSGDTRTYSVTAVAGITYNWTAPAGSNITGGQGTSSVTVTFTPNFVSAAAISVTANNQCGTSVARTLNVGRNLPATPSAISGPSSICTGSVGTYSVPVVAGVSSYTWTIPGGGVAQGSTTGNSINVLWSTNRAGNLAIRANNNCGSSGSRSLGVAISCPRTLAGDMMAVSDLSSTVIYPNPASDIATVRFTSKENTTYSFTVSDIAGRKLFSDKQEALVGNNMHQLKLSRLTKGTYLVLVESKDTKQTLKINVQ